MEKNWFSGKKATFFGDSITHGVGTSRTYCSMICETLGMTEVNLGRTGWTICEGGHRNSQLTMTDEIPQDSDLIVVFLGANDWDQAVRNGEGAKKYEDKSISYYDLGSRGCGDTSTLYGAAEALCEKLKARFDGTETRIVFLTPLQSKNCHSIPDGNTYFDREKKNIHGVTQGAFCSALADAVGAYGYPTLNLFTDCDIYYRSPEDETASQYYWDGIHPNKSGHERIALALETFLLSDRVK